MIKASFFIAKTMSYGSPSQWERKGDVDTTVPENPIHAKLVELRKTVEALNRVTMKQIPQLYTSIMTQLKTLRVGGYQGRIDLQIAARRLTTDQREALIAEGTNVKIISDSPKNDLRTVIFWADSFKEKAMGR